MSEPGPGRPVPFITVEDVVLHCPGGEPCPPLWWQIRADQHWAIVGPNGSGKSALARTLSGRAPVAGGRIVYHLSKHNGTGRGSQPRERIAYVDFEAQRAFMGWESPFYQARWNSVGSQGLPSVADYLSQQEVRGGSPYRIVEMESDPDAYLAERAQVAALLGIERLLDRRIVEISSGERRKVLLARALLQHPELLILDNPFAGLDQSFRIRLREIVQDLMQDSMRLMVVVPTWDDIPPGITHVLAMEGGRIVALGPRAVNGDIREKARRADIVAEDAKRPDVILNGASQPDVILNEAEQPDVILNGTSQPDVILNGAGQPDVILNGTGQPDVILNGTSQPDVILNGAKRSEESRADENEILRFAQDDGVGEREIHRCAQDDGRGEGQSHRCAQDDGRVEGGRGGILVHMEDVTVSYGGVPILEGIHWTVREGERWALLGPNGAGKTTLLSLILGDNPQAYANQITLFGRRRGTGESIWEIKRQTGWMAPELHLYYPRGITCLDVVCSGFFDSVGLYRHCSPERRRVAIGWLERLEVMGLAGRAFHAVSEGQQRLVLLARAVVKEPLLLVLDEPCQGLDAAGRDRVLHTVDSICEGLRMALIHVTHDPLALPRSITHVLQLDAGRIASRGAFSHFFCEARHDESPTAWSFPRRRESRASATK